MMNIRDMILEKTRQGLDVFHHYINTPFAPKRRFKNPLYTDTKASCYVYFNSQKGCYLLKDFGSTEYSGDCFWFVALLNGWDTRRDFMKVLRKINEDMNLYIPFGDQGNDTRWLQNKQSVAQPQLTSLHANAATIKNEKTEKADKPSSTFKAKIAYKDFSTQELEYWQKYGITQSVLERFHVEAVKATVVQMRKARDIQSVQRLQNQCLSTRPLMMRSRFIARPASCAFSMHGLLTLATCLVWDSFRQERMSSSLPEVRRT